MDKGNKISKDKDLEEFIEEKLKEIGLYEDIYIDHQRRKIMKIFENNMPEFMKKHGNKVNVLLIKNFSMMFKILTALDSFKLTRVMLNLFVDAQPKSIKLLQKINKIAKYYLTDILLRVYEGHLNHIPWVNEVIINDCFDEFTVDKVKDANVVDLYRYGDIRYNEDNLPDMIKWENLIKHGTKKDKERYERYKKLKKKSK